MKKILIPSVLLLAACAERPGSDTSWSNDCDKHFSYNSREHAQCLARVKDQQKEAEMGSCCDGEQDSVRVEKENAESGTSKYIGKDRGN